MPKLLHGTVEKNKLKIERAALYLFTRRGFHGTTVREIAKKAGISMGKLYIYYDTKEDIFID
jgi:TetR/AcrR family transcriptional regulator, cholesterol catabolism regulator